MNNRNARRYVRAINKMCKGYSNYTKDLILVTSFTKSEITLLIKVLSIQTTTKFFIRKLHENTIYEDAEKWTRNKLESMARLSGDLTDEEIKKTKEIVKKEFVTSIKDKKYISKFLQSNYNSKLKNVISTSTDEEGKPMSLNQDFYVYYDELIESGEIKLYIDLIIKQDSLNERLAKKIYQELLIILNRNKSLTNKEIDVAIFLQNLLIFYLPRVLEMSNKKDNYNISALRKSSEHLNIKYNALCINCHKLLKREFSNISCTKKENSDCYKKIIKKNNHCLPQTSDAIKCSNCNKTTNKFISHKIHSIVLIFCCERCYETYRKRVGRKKKIT